MAATALMALAGFVQGILILSIGEIALWVEKLIFNESRPRCLSYLIAVVLGFSPALLVLVAPAFGLRAGRAFFIAILVGGLVGTRGLSRARSGYDRIARTVSATRVPPIAVFGRFANEDKQMEDFMLCLGDRDAKKLWRKFLTIPVDLDEDGELLKKYDVNPAHGLQSMFFRKDGTRIEFDGRDRVLSEDMLDPRRFEIRLQAALDLWNAS